MNAIDDRPLSRVNVIASVDVGMSQVPE